MMMILYAVILLLTYSDCTFTLSLWTTFPTLLPSTARKCTVETESSSLTYLVDTTGSMVDDLQQLKKVNDWLLDRVSARFPCGVRNYTMVEFNDPDIGPVRQTNSKAEFAEFFKKISPHGGLTDCPELAMAGLKLALESSAPYSFIMVLTDASAKDYANTALLNDIYSLISKKHIQIFFLITGLCTSVSDPGYQIYRKIALKSFGNVLQVPVSQIGNAFNDLENMLSAPINSSTPIFIKEYPSGSHYDPFDVKGNLTGIKVTYDGKVDGITVYKPKGATIYVPVNKSAILGVFPIATEEAEKGKWQINVRTKEPTIIRITGDKETNISTTTDCSECHPNATCEEYAGRKRCSCKNGYLGDGFHCSDDDECSYSWTNTCPGKCVNTLGSYYCGCQSGYRETIIDCVDIDECSDPKLNNCHSLATCTNTKGSYSCSCPYGYYGDGRHCETNECTTGVCGQDMDCIKHRGSFNCFDPCLKHTALNEPWRSTDNSGDSYCDKDKSGWYRFIGAGGIRMPEKCVTGQNCSTEAPIWINGSHPSPGDGIINLTACAYYNEDCCHWSTAVQVKACPVGYHVYKLSRTPKCPLAYCTDPSSLNEPCPCTETEERKLVNGAYGCYCKDGNEDIGIEDLELELKCSTDEMKASFRTCQLKHFHVKSIHLSNSNCIAVKEASNGLISVTSPLQNGACGTELDTNGTHAIYKNTIYVQLEREAEQLIIRNNDAERSFTCSYPLDVEIDVGLLKPDISVQRFRIEGRGKFKVRMSIYKDGSFLSPYNKTSITLSTTKRLYVGVALENQKNSTYAVVMKNCYATPSRHANDSTQYPIIKNKCPNKRDTSIRVIENGVSTKGRFSLHMFKFIGDENLVYLHCEVNICDIRKGPCKPSCSGVRTYETGPEEDNIVVKCGPIAR
ncbi:uromodulin-like isoform X2 [Eleutherodactylus coqui]|uniref:uromodulin-like isoform X2 n=1 Tax=Eleutherodactylus coqui TaxID=57060 RepID=UPI003462B4A8